MNISIIGTGYVGLVTGTCLADMGHTVHCIDINKDKIDNLNNGIIPIYEPGLDDLVIKNVKAEKLFFTTNYNVLEYADAIFSAVCTPSNEDGSENNEVVCEIDEDTKILGLNYFVCIDNSQKKLSPSINDESRAKKDTFLIRGYASRYVEIRVGYNNKKLNFSSVSDNYIITDVMKKDSTININIDWK